MAKRESKFEPVIKAIALLAIKGDNDTVSVCSIAEACRDQVDFEDLRFVCQNLQCDGLISIERSFEHSDAHIRLISTFYHAFDPLYLGSDPKADARQIARLLMERHGLVAPAKMRQAFGWCKRRFNPAYRIILDELLKAGGNAQARGLSIGNGVRIDTFSRQHLGTFLRS